MLICTCSNLTMTLVVAGFSSYLTENVQGCFSNLRLHAYYYGPDDPSRQHLLSGLLTTDHLVTFYGAAGQRQVLGI